MARVEMPTEVLILCGVVYRSANMPNAYTAKPDAIASGLLICGRVHGWPPPVLRRWVGFAKCLILDGSFSWSCMVVTELAAILSNLMALAKWAVENTLMLNQVTCTHAPS
jgi:hypothetical protein